MRFARFIPLLLILAAPTVMLYPLWSNPVSAGEDDVIFYYPLRKMVGQALAQGQWPLTNPMEATGGALLADPQAAVLHPTTWLFAFLAPKLAYSLSIFLAFSAAGGGMYLYLRRLGLVRPASMFGSVVFMFCGFMVGHRVHLSVINAAAMLPWILLGIELLRRLPDSPSRGARAFVVLTAAVFLAIASGHWPTLIHMGIICLPYALLRARPLGAALAVCLVSCVLAAAIASPQIAATASLLSDTTRQKTGYAFAGENSFVPLSAILAFFPMIQGCRTPNFFPNTWWGSWHLCEMLGYVGLSTLALAAAAVWKFFRKTPRSAKGERPPDLRPSEHVGLVRAWTWISIGAFIWMLGYYLPTYRLIHMTPILGVVRCPARMVLAIEAAAATLSALAIHYASGHEISQSMGKTIRRSATRVLPAAMLISLAAWAAIAHLADIPFLWRFFFAGTQEQAKASFAPGNPAVWVQVILAAGAIAGTLLWLRRPGTRAGILVCLLLADLFFITRFVDVPGAGVRPQDPEWSPAAAWLREHGNRDGDYRILTLSEAYSDRAAELLRPKVCQSMGFSSLGSYGPFQSPNHAHLLGLAITGNCHDWPSLVRRNYLLSLYNVRYIVTAEPLVRQTLDGIVIDDSPAGPDGDGENLLAGPVKLDNASDDGGGILRLKTPVMWWLSRAIAKVRLEGDTVYRVGLDARGPDGGAAFHLRVQVSGVFPDNLPWDRTGLSIHPEEIGTQWRHFEWTFATPGDGSGEKDFELITMSERPIEVRNVSLRRSRLDTPLNPRNSLPQGAKVYELRALLPALNGPDAPVAIYENMLCRGPTEPLSRELSTPEHIEWLKWQYPKGDRSRPDAPPDVSLRVKGDFASKLKWISLPGAAVFLVIAGLCLRRARTKG